jgi:WD40 repeat protein
LKPGQEVARLDGVGDTQDRLISVAYLPDGQTIVGATFQKLGLWKPDTGRHVRNVDVPPPLLLDRVAPLPDSRSVVLGSRNPFVRIIDVQQGGEVRQFVGHVGPINCFAVSLDGRRLVTGGGMAAFENNQPVMKEGKPVFKDATARVWDVATGKELQKYEGHDYPIYGAAIASNGRRVVTVSRGPGLDHLRFWDAETGKAIRRLGQGLDRPVVHLALCPDDRHLLLTFDLGKLVLWDTETDREVRTFETTTAYIMGLAVTPGGHYVLTSHEQTPIQGQPQAQDFSLRLWEVATGKLVRRFEGHVTEAGALAISPDGRRAVSVSRDGDGRIWDLGIADPAGKPPGGAP